MTLIHPAKNMMNLKKILKEERSLALPKHCCLLMYKHSKVANYMICQYLFT